MYIYTQWPMVLTNGFDIPNSFIRSIYRFIWTCAKCSYTSKRHCNIPCISIITYTLNIHHKNTYNNNNQNKYNNNNNDNSNNNDNDNNKIYPHLYNSIRTISHTHTHHICINIHLVVIHGVSRAPQNHCWLPRRSPALGGALPLPPRPRMLLVPSTVAMAMGWGYQRNHSHPQAVDLLSSRWFIPILRGLLNSYGSKIS